MKDILIQITSGRGPTECCWVVSQVLNLLIKEANHMNIDTRVIQSDRGEVKDSLNSVNIELRGKGVKDFLKNWIGTIQWIGQSKFRKNHKRKNWFVGVNTLDSKDVQTFYEHDVHYEFTRASGPGGQHVNKVSTAVRATHIPSGEVVFASTQRSQLQNKNEASRRLRELFQSKALQIEKEQIKEGWINHNQLDRGDPIRVFRERDLHLTV